MSDCYILCLETSGPTCSVSISKNGRATGSLKEEGSWQHSQYLTSKIVESLSIAGLDMLSLNAVAISGGPGSYTGLRVGASTAKGICYALNLPLISLSTLSIIAAPEVKKLNVFSLKWILPLIDARRDEVYYNIYDHSLSPIIDTQAHIITSESFIDSYEPDGALICGDGANKASDILPKSDKLIFNHSYPLAEHMAEIAFKKYRTKQFEDIAYFNPFYLKPPNITKSKKALF